ncbi:hypothetical protein [Austwickia chelonae]|uniref:hypothetical protein n=1 Tax=Austwickia chelonae TaxID=100225 RepID=UPI0013C31630|nr:hypothetical protein [Austwickia chelonae]
MSGRPSSSRNRWNSSTRMRNHTIVTSVRTTARSPAVMPSGSSTVGVAAAVARSATASMSGANAIWMRNG